MVNKWYGIENTHHLNPFKYDIAQADPDSRV